MSQLIETLRFNLQKKKRKNFLFFAFVTIELLSIYDLFMREEEKRKKFLFKLFFFFLGQRKKKARALKKIRNEDVGKMDVGGEREPKSK